MNDKKQVRKTPSAVRYVHLLFIASVPVVAAVSLALPLFGYVPVFRNDDTLLIFIETLFFAFSLLFLELGSNWQRRVAQRVKKDNMTDGAIANSHLGQISFFESIVWYGFILRLLGSNWYISTLLFLFAGIALARTFPTNKRWNEWQGKQMP